ncbi:MAG TPA: alpha amylase family protein [bacterium]|nr:alpha amylase family protein [bacterium]
MKFVRALIPACTAAALVTAACAAAAPPPAGAASGRIPHHALWIEPGANLRQLSTVEGVREALDRAKAAGIDSVMPEAKNAWGFATYPSTFIPPLAESPIPHSGAGGDYPPPTEWFPRDYDLLGTIITEAHARGLKVHVAINSFGEGYSPMRAGPSFTQPDFQATAYVGFRSVVAPNGTSYELTGVDVPRGNDQLVLYTPASGAASPASRWGVEAAVAGGTVTEVRDRAAGTDDPGPIAIPKNGYVLSGHGAAAAWMRDALAAGTSVAIGPVQTRMEPSSAHDIFAFANPANPDVWNYELAAVHEIVARYDVDGIVLDRTRYDDLSEDFSDASRAAFERSLGHPVAHWPDDIYTYVAKGYGVERRFGPLYKAWLGYRAHTIMTYTRAAAQVARATRPGVTVGMYVGAWYPVYYNEGVNWGSPGVWAPYPWIGATWVQSGLAPLLDYLMIGLYYRPVTESEAVRRHDNPLISVQGSGRLGETLVRGAIPVVGSLLLPLYEGQPQTMTRAIRMSDQVTQGTMLFDLVYLNTLNLWDAIPKPAPPRGPAAER